VPCAQAPEGDRLVGEVRILENGVLMRLKKYDYTGFQLTGEQDYHGDLARENRYVYKKYAYAQSCPRPTSITHGTWYTPDHGHAQGIGDIAAEHFVYDGYGRETEHTDLNGHKTRREYDALGRLLKEIQPGGASKSRAYYVNTMGSQIASTDERGHKKLLTYTSLGNIKEEYDDTAKVPVARYEYDQFGRIIRETRCDPDTPGQVKTITTRGYDHFDRERSRRTQDRAGSGLYSKSNLYNDWNLLHAKTVNGLAGALSVTTTVVKDPWGQVISKSCGNTRTAYTYDKLGNRRSQSDALGGVTKWEYTFDSQVKKETNALGHSAEAFCNALGQKEYSIDLQGHRTSYHYNGLGHLTGQVGEFDQSGPAEIQYSCDNLGNVLEKRVRRLHGTDQDWSETRYRYDQCGRLTHTVADDNGKGSCTKFEYNAAGDKTRVVTGIVCGSFADWESTMPALGSQPATTYDYDHLGNMTLMRDPQNQTERYIYDALGRLRRKTDRNGGVTTYTYDALDRLTREEAAGKEST